MHGKGTHCTNKSQTAHKFIQTTTFYTAAMDNERICRMYNKVLGWCEDHQYTITYVGGLNIMRKHQLTMSAESVDLYFYFGKSADLTQFRRQFFFIAEIGGLWFYHILQWSAIVIFWNDLFGSHSGSSRFLIDAKLSAFSVHQHRTSCTSATNFGMVFYAVNEQILRQQQ